MFFKLVNTNELSYGPCVQSEDYLLISEDHTNYTYPVDGWYWFSTEEEANTFFNIIPPQGDNNVL